MKKARAGRRSPRGMTLLIALAVISVVTAATLVSLRVVSQESEMQGQERHAREAFFAAEAGLAEGREVISLLISDQVELTKVMVKLGTQTAGKPGYNAQGEVDEANFPGTGFSWYEVIPATPFTLLPGKAVDPNKTDPSKELRDKTGRPFRSFPEQSRVSYRVFVHDDEDENGSAPDARHDLNHAVWVVSVGEVKGAGDVVLARSVVRALVFSDMVAAEAGGYGGQKGQGSTKSTPSSPTSKIPDLSKGTQI
jgi:type II secretory pathway pseudopilin PulG